MEIILRKKFIKVSMSAFFVVLFTIAVFLNISSYMNFNHNSQQVLTFLARNDGTFPMNPNTLPSAPRLPQEAQFTTRFFSIRIDFDGDILGIDTKNINAINVVEARKLGREILDSSKDFGVSGNYKFLLHKTDYGQILIFLDCESEINMLTNFLVSSILLSFLALISVYILLIFVSKKAVAPFIKNYNNQQEFITNVSHELKTPLAIIKTSTDVIECEHNSCEWTDNIHHQINRLTELVNYLISLSKMDEDEVISLKTDFSLSDAILETTDSFSLISKDLEKEICSDISKNISFHGDEQSIRMLISILVDNSLKYSCKNSKIDISLTEKRHKKVLEVSNFADNLEARDYSELFERFYRLDDSRNSSSGGFGIGLAMAKTIVKKHGGYISAKSHDGMKIVFKVEL